MLSPSPRWKLCTLILVASSLFFHQTSYATPNGDPTVREITKREAPERVFNVSAVSPRVVATEKKQRFCLSRLRDALISVCGGNNGMPQFFNPSQHQTPVIHRSIGTVAEGAVKNFKNDIPTMAQPQPRRALRRRSRRNIVRECCDKPCSYSQLLKYCSPSARLNNYQSTDSALANQQGHNVSPQQQCVSVADLQHFYLKFLRKQWKKNDQQVYLEEHESDIPENWNDDSSDTFSRNVRKQWKEPAPTELTPGQEGRDVNEINENSQIESTSSRVDESGNLYTLPPVTRVMNIPFGLNDYLY